MIVRKWTKNRLSRAIFGCLFAIIGMFSALMMGPSENVYAEPSTGTTTTSTATTATKSETTQTEQQTSVSCEDSLGALGWLVCPTTGKIAEATDWLYEQIEDILVINPVEMKDGSPIYEIWKYVRGITNIVFIILFLVVIYSQLTGVGISNYGVKKILPKMIVVAILVNLSFIVCSLAVDFSNIVGNGLRGVFTSIEESTMASMEIGVGSNLSTVSIYGAMQDGLALGIAGGVIAFETGAIWMLIPVLLGALVSVVTGLITIALRQAVVALLIMISPLAMVAFMLPNTEQWFKKWRQLLTKMLVFYPMFSLLFGASNLAGWAIITSAKSGFGVLLGVAVQIFPLFFSWKMMQMSGTFLGDINAKMRALAAKPLATNRAWADSHRQLTRARHLERNQMPSARLMNFLAYRKAARENETDSINTHLKSKYTAMSDAKDYDKNGNLSRRGLERYNRQALTMRYKRFSQMHTDNLEKGFSGVNPEYKETIAKDRNDLLGSRGVYAPMIKGGTYEERVKVLDKANMNASDELKAEIERKAEIDYYNNKGFFERTLNAKLAEGDFRALKAGDSLHKMHPGLLDDPENLARYERFKRIMESEDEGVQTVLAGAASSMNAQAQIRRNKFQTASELTPATQNVVDHINDLLQNRDSIVKNIDAIIGGLRVLNMRGDTDKVAKELEHNLMGTLLNDGVIELGTYASQAISNYTLFDVGGNDPVLRRLGKYINMQTAALYDDKDPEKRRVRKDVSWWEYVNSGYVECDENGNVARDGDGNVIIKKTRGMRELLLGTSYSKVERTAYQAQREGVRAASYDVGPDGELLPEFSLKRYFDNMDGLYNATLANIIGDQFSYLSGSEQIISLAKDLTGVGKDGKWDWKYIFGDELSKPTLEQKAEYIVRSRNLMKTFLRGHVPAQIARSKTDMLQAIEKQYALLDEVMSINEEGQEVVDLEKLKNLEERVFTDGNEEDEESYKHFLGEKRDAVKKRFQESFAPDALKGFVKMHHKGYQGEAKDGLIKLLDPDALYKKYFPNGEGNNQKKRNLTNYDDEDDDDGMPADFGGRDSGSPIYNEARKNVEDMYRTFSSEKSDDIEGFWKKVKDVIISDPSMFGRSADIEEFENGIPQRTSLADMYRDIINKFFGGFNG